MEGKLRECVWSSLRVAKKAGLRRIAYPPMGTGFYGVPLDMAADVMLGSFKAFLETETSLTETSLEEVIICVIDYRDYVPFSKRMEVLL